MTIRSLLILALPAILLSGQTAERSLPETLTAHLRNTPLLHVDFVQTRTLAALSRPLKSSGSLVLSRDQGVIWQVKKPLSLLYVVGSQGILELGADGKKKVTTSKDVPVIAQMGRILKSLLQGRWSAVEDYFTVKAEGRPEKWEVTLTPRAQTAAFLQRVQVMGGRFIERVRVVEASGDRMELAFERPRADEPLSEREAQLFAFR